ncbi:beta-N-acetylhexosaminidase [Butyrivibrio sp. Su6]|uniref:beta-N-acetylhexosaminidase n=1 Tax=Butyrivibrio sp. Su6 TaxID=1520810 RepID=UPI00089E87EE|nr:beta-N-acetylhexosaminidase [Butyrivibrio sp. Su6]SEG29593.1 beta-N-acetylhexosaminidase [Butyrivibrio sp. Su6]
MTIEEMVGQKFVVGFPGYELNEEVKEIIGKYKIGNIILFKENLRDEAQIKKLCAEITEFITSITGYPPFIMIDQEGGMVARLSENMGNIPGAMAISATGDSHNAYTAGYYTGLQLKELGINFNLAPVMDINSNPSNPIIGCRSYGDTPEKVSEYALQMAKGLDDAGVLSCAKHFPGHGDVSTDSHVTLPCVDKELDELEKLELVPFKKGIENNIPAIMSAHILFPKVEKDRIPATMSRKILTDLLRKEMGFEGLILTDCLEMQAIKKFYGVEEGALAAFKAGADIIMISHTPSYFPEVISRIEAAINDGSIATESIKESAERILSYKEKYLKCIKEDKSSQDFKEKIEDIREQTLTLVSKADYPLGIDSDTLFISPRPFNVGLVGNVKEDVASSFCEILAEKFGAKALVISENPNEEEIERAAVLAANSSFILFGTYNAHVFRGQLKLIEKVLKKNPKAAIFALRNPYDLRDIPDTVWKYAAFEYTLPMINLIGKLLNNEIRVTGKLPVKIS